MIIEPATDQRLWDDFLTSQPFSPFLQSWTMGEVYRDIGQEPIRLWARDETDIHAICQGIVVPARRGKHVMVQYGPIISDKRVANSEKLLEDLLHALRKIAREKNCSFIRMSPFWSEQNTIPIIGAKSSPLHLLAEHIWYLPLTGKTEDEIFKNMRSTTRNLIRRAEKEGVTIECSCDPIRDVEEFIRLHDETRKRHKFVPYSNAFFRAQVGHFAPSQNVLVYLARFQGRVIAASIHMQFGGETSYHHGASSHEFSKIPASYLLQWTAIRDALRRGDTIYNFWGIAPSQSKNHPFAGVTLFKTGFGGQLLNLMHCIDLPLRKTYYVTRAFEYVRKWKRGF